MKSKVFFTRDISPEGLYKVYKKLGISLKGNVACKVHSGEPGNQNFLRGEFWKEVINDVNGTVVECNTAYDGPRRTAAEHYKVFEKHGWSSLYKVEIMDENSPDLVLDIPDGEIIKKNYVGSGISKYDSMVVLSHFKGHPMGGYGGALKQLSIGCASAFGKGYIHSAGHEEVNWETPQDLFLKSMADAAASVVRYFKGNILYLNVMKNMSVDCDCCSVAEDPCIDDIGICASLDPVAIDKACVDMALASKSKGVEHFKERIVSRNGLLTISAAEKLGVGSSEYELIDID